MILSWPITSYSLAATGFPPMGVPAIPLAVIIGRGKNKSTPFSRISFPLNRGYCQH
jgi:hypothetical protein